MVEKYNHELSKPSIAAYRTRNEGMFRQMDIEEIKLLSMKLSKHLWIMPLITTKLCNHE